MKGPTVKFRLVFETTTAKGHPVVLKFKVPPSKHQGLVNFLKIVMEQDQEVQFAVEKLSDSKRELSKVKGKFHLVEDVSETDAETKSES